MPGRRLRGSTWAWQGVAVLAAALAAGAPVLVGGTAGAAVTQAGAPRSAAVQTAAVTPALPAESPLPGPVTYSQPPSSAPNCTGDTYTVPADVTRLRTVVIGAGASDLHTQVYTDAASGGSGEMVTADIDVFPGEHLYVNVAHNGSGGAGSDGSNSAGDAGGDASYISTDPNALKAGPPANPYTTATTCDASSLVVIAGGGGGGGGNGVRDGGKGGDAGFAAGIAGRAGGHNAAPSGAGGGGGTQTAGGTGGNGATTTRNYNGLSGTFLNGGCGGECATNEKDLDGAGGGGGGYYGGGGGGDGAAGGGGGGGGGSSFVEAGAIHVSGSTTSDLPSVTLTPIVGAPLAPTGVTAVAGLNEATVSWTAPTIDGDSPIEFYNITAQPGGFEQTGVLSSPVTIHNLAAGTHYTFTVTAVNEAGEGPASAPSNPVVPFTIPRPPKITSATAGNGQAIVAFTPSRADQNSGNPITSYTVTARAGVGVTSGPGITATGTTSPITVTGLTNGTNYTVTVYATNAEGDGPESAPKVVFPATVPGAPADVTAGNATPPGAATGTVSVSFTPPASDGGGGIQSYTAVSSPGGITATGINSPIQVTGLTIGSSYTFTVYATNSLGNGPASDPSNAVIPAPVPSPPQTPSAAPLDQAAYVSCLPPASDGGSPIVSYTVTSSPGGITATGPSCPILVTGLTEGIPYTFTVTATNQAGGTSVPSQPTSKVVLHAPAGPPPRNDNFASAQVISGTSGSVSGTNVGATVEPGEPTIQDNRGGASVWYKWVVPATGTYQFDTCTEYPAVLGLIGAFTGNSVSTLTGFGPGPSPDACPTAADGSGEAGSTLIISPIAGQTIYLKFDGINPGSNANPPYQGPFTLQWSEQS